MEAISSSENWCAVASFSSHTSSVTYTRARMCAWNKPQSPRTQKCLKRNRQKTEKDRVPGRVFTAQLAGSKWGSAHAQCDGNLGSCQCRTVLIAELVQQPASSLVSAFPYIYFLMFISHRNAVVGSFFFNEQMDLE